MHQFVTSQNCVKETYCGKTFEGNEYTKLMKKISDLSNVRIKPQIDVLVKFDDLRNKVSGVEFHEIRKIVYMTSY